MLSSPGTVTPCLKNSYFKNHLLGLPLRWLVNHCRRWKKERLLGTSGLNVEMILAGGDDIILAIPHLINCIIAENKIPDDWCLSYKVKEMRCWEEIVEDWSFWSSNESYGRYTCNHHKNSSWYWCSAIWFHAWERNHRCNIYPLTSSWKASQQTQRSLSTPLKLAWCLELTHWYFTSTFLTFKISVRF